MIRDDELADDVITGRLKGAKSYHRGYGHKTYDELKRLAKAGDRRAKQMKKLMEQVKRLRDKIRSRPR